METQEKGWGHSERRLEARPASIRRQAVPRSWVRCPLEAGSAVAGWPVASWPVADCPSRPVAGTGPAVNGCRSEAFASVWVRDRARHLSAATIGLASLVGRRRCLWVACGWRHEPARHRGPCRGGVQVGEDLTSEQPLVRSPLIRFWEPQHCGWLGGWPVPRLGLPRPHRSAIAVRWRW